MEHLRDEQIEEAQFQRDEEMEDQMEQLIFNDARAGEDVDDYDFDQFLNDFGIESQDFDVVIANSGGQVYMCL